MSFTAIAGMNTRANVLDARVPVDMSNLLVWLNPSANPFLTMTSKLKKTPAKEVTVKWLDLDDMPKYVQAEGAAQQTGVQTLTIANWALLRLGHILINDRTGEVIRVQASPTTTTVSVYRTFGTTGGTVEATDRLIISGSAEEEGADAPPSRTIRDNEGYNSIQLFKHTVNISGTMDSVSTYGEKLLATERKRQMTEHKKALERAMCFGEISSGKTGADGKPVRTMRGAFGPGGFIATNRYDMSGGYTEDDFSAYAQEIFDAGDGSDVKWAFGGRTALAGVDSFAKTRLHVIHPSKDKGKINYGISIARYRLPNGELDLIHAKDWTTPERSRMLGVVDPKFLKMRPLRDTRMDQDQGVGTVDAVVDVILTETSMEFRQEKMHGVFFGM